MKKNKTKKYDMIVALAIIAIVILDIFVVQDAFENKKIQKGQEIIQEKGVLIYGGESDSPPMTFVDEEGIYKGVTIDYMAQLSIELGVEIQTVPCSHWAQVVEGIKLNTFNLTNSFFDDERAEYMAFSDPIYKMRIVLATGIQKNYELSDISHLNVAVQEDDITKLYIEKHYPDARLTCVKTVREGLGLLMDGAVDCVAGDEPVILNFIAEDKLKGHVQILDTPVFEDDVAIGVPKDEAGIIPAINAAIKNINQQGEVEKIQEKWLALSSTYLIDEREKIIKRMLPVLGMMIAIIVFIYLNNIFLRRRVASSTRELQGKSNELQLIFNQMPEGILLLDEQKAVINGNHNFFDVSLEKPENELFCRDYMQKICGMENCDGNCIVRQCFDKQIDVEVKVQTNTSTYQIHGISTKVENGEGTQKGVLLIVRDITVDEINERQILQSSKMIAIGQLAAGMAHQIKNPLGVVRTQSYLIRNRKDDTNIEKSLDYVDESVSRASSIIDNVLNFWRVSGEKLEPVDIGREIEAVIDLNSNSMRKQNIIVQEDIEENLVFQTNPEVIKHVLHNLVSNAVDAMVLGGSLTVTAFRDGQWLCIEICDTGCGISEENLNNLFNPFFTTKEPGKGTGLGLFVAYSECEKIGGSIDVESRVGEGTCFTIRIPEGKK